MSLVQVKNIRWTTLTSAVDVCARVIYAWESPVSRNFNAIEIEHRLLDVDLRQTRNLPSGICLVKASVLESSNFTYIKSMVRTHNCILANALKLLKSPGTHLNIH